MTPTAARERLCAACNKVVHDLSGRSDRDVKALVSGGPVCVRYLYDVHGRILLGGAPEGAQIVPASSLLSKVARSKWLAVAALAAAPLVFEACGGNAGGYGGTYAGYDDAGPGYGEGDGTGQYAPAEPEVSDGGEDADADVVDVDAGADADAGPDEDDPDAG